MPYLAFGRRYQPGQHVGEGALAVALHPGDSEDLSLMHREGESVEIGVVHG